MNTETRSLAELTQNAVSLLYRELGVINTVRFVRQFTVGFGNYTEERKALFADKSMDEITEEIRRRRQ